ncbi:hypothetical protein O6H91_21G039300 [Diphasiastrum complanatum]|uniref:Uncharacterized protein n=1 Tax=Diphasiastrum complanatum TaxID=34168 RepID=A0ACC2AJN1_DIPCM|nr:hypothetical protein O6H91_21G039300 [Diphasiastrum complanatum]
MGSDVIAENSQEGAVQSGSSDQQTGNNSYQLSVAIVHPTKDHTRFDVPAMYGQPSFATTPLTELAPRVAAILYSFIAFVVMAAAPQIDLKSSNYEAFNYVLAMNIITFVYSILQVAHWAYKFKYDETVLPKLVEVFITFACDQVLAYLLMSASSSGATSALLSKNACTGKEKFCVQIKASVSMSFLAFFSIAASSLLSGYQVLVSL